MNLFNDYYKSLLGEMASNEKYRGKKSAGAVRTGKRSRDLNTPEQIKKANDLFSKKNLSSKKVGGKEGAKNFNSIKKLLALGKINEAYAIAEELKNTIRDLTTYKDKKQRDFMRKCMLDLIDATNTPYHSFDQASKYKKQIFVDINEKKVRNDIKNKTLKKKIGEEIIENLPYWNDLYHGIGTLLTTYDMFDDPEKYSTTIEELKSKNNAEMYEYAKTSDLFKTKYFKPRSISDSSSHKEKTTVTEADYDKIPIFFMTDDGPASKLITIPLTVQEKLKYPTLKQREDNIPMRRDVFVAKTNNLFGYRVNKPPKGYRYSGGNRKVVPELGTIENPLTVAQVKEKINHDESFKEFLKKYPIESDVYLETNPNGTLKFRVEYHRVMAESKRKGLNLKDRGIEIQKRNREILEKNKSQKQQNQTNPTQNLKGLSNPVVSDEDDEEDENV